MSEPAFTPAIAVPYADVFVHAGITGADPVRTPGGRLMRPTMAEIRYYYDFGVSQWRHQVALNGRLWLDGADGRRTSVVFGHDSPDMPGWLAAFVGQHVPPFTLPDMRVVSA